MQPTLFSYTIELTRKIKFPCQVNRIGMTALVTHKEDNGLHTLYRVTFGDGHKDSYIVGEPLVQEGFGRTRRLDDYEEAIYDDLSILPVLLKHQRKAYVRVGEEDGESYNVWIIEANGVFKIYFKGMYQFTLRKTSQWEIKLADKNGPLNLQMASLISNYIDETFLGLSKSLRVA